MTKSLEEIYAAPSVEPEIAADTGVAQTIETPEVEQPRDVPAVEAPGAPPAPNSNAIPKGYVPLAALEDVRRKNQETERKLAQLEARQAAKREPEDDDFPDPLVDPKAYHDHMKTEREVERFNDRLEITTELVVREFGEDKWNEAEQAVLEAAKRSPDIAQRIGQAIASARNPARRTFEIGTEILEARAKNDPVKVRQALKDEIIAELGLTRQAPDTRNPAPAASPKVPTSLATLQTTAPRTPVGRPIKRRSLDELYG